MKNNNVKYNSILTILILVSFLFKSDIIPENSHRVVRDVFITNCEDYNNIQLIGYVTGPMSESNSFYTINSNQKLTKGYKFNTLNIFAINKTKLETIGGVENLTEDYVLSEISPKIFTETGDYYFDNRSSLEKDEMYYEITEINGDKLKIELRKRILTYSDGNQETFNF